MGCSSSKQQAVKEPLQPLVPATHANEHNRKGNTPVAVSRISGLFPSADMDEQPEQRQLQEPPTPPALPDPPTQRIAESDEAMPRAAISPRSSMRKSVKIQENTRGSLSASDLNPTSLIPQKHLNELARRVSIRQDEPSPSVPTQDAEIASVTTVRTVIIDGEVVKNRTYAIKSFSAPAGHPDHDPDEHLAEEQRATLGRFFDPENIHLAPPSALQRIALKNEKGGNLTQIERHIYGRATILSDAEYHPPLSSVSVQYPVGIINPSHANGTGDAIRTASGLHCDLSSANGVAEIKMKVGSSIQAQFEARRDRSEHPLRAMLRAHSVAPVHYKKGSKLLTPINVDLSARSPKSFSVLTGSSPGVLSSSSTFTSSGSAGGCLEEKGSELDERDRHRKQTQSSRKKKNTMIVTATLDSSRLTGFK